MLEREPTSWNCNPCGRSFPIVDGVARFVDGSRYARSFGYQWKRFAKVQLDSANGTTRSRDAFVEKTGWRLEDLSGVRVLDAGCGMGRFSEVCIAAGAEVHAVDLSEAVEVAAENLDGRTRGSFYQADIFRLPFAEASFDRIFSIGVLHHTPDTKQAFLRLVRLLKPGGRIAIWVYSTRLKRFVGSEFLRPVTSRIPQALMLQLARLSIPLYPIYRVPFAGRLAQILLPISLEDDPTWRWLDTFDWYTPRFQWKHTTDEVISWFEEAGLRNIEHGPTPVSVRGVRPVGGD
jgi:ubiquinone/menaquinone biosynthesis C-methylase UbiE